MGIQTIPVPVAAAPTLQETQITSSGTFTVPAGVTRLWCHVYGGGSGGAYKTSQNQAAVATAGGVVVQMLTVTPLASLTATIGAGGAAGANYAPGGDGANSVFDSITANGGLGATLYVGATGAGRVLGSSSFDVSSSGANSPANSGAGGASATRYANNNRNGGSGRIIVRYLT